MANLLAGFVKGFADNQVDQIQERRKLENDEKKARMLQQLASETQRANFLFEEGYKKSNKIDENMSTKDFKTGKITLRALDGSELGSRDMTQAEKDTYANDAKKDALGIQNLESTIASRARDDARQDRTAAASIAAANRSNRGEGLDGSGSKKVSDIDIANELIYRYKAEVNEAAKAGNISTAGIRSGAIALVANSRNGEEAQMKFMEFLNNYRTGRKSTDERKRRLDDGSLIPR